MISGIYAIVCKDIKIEEVYVGSTNNLEHRIEVHKFRCNDKCNNNYNLKVYKFIRDNGGFDNFKFIVLEHYRGEEEDLRQLEQNFIDTFPKELILNSKRAFGKDYERYKEQKKKYKEDNKEKVKENSKEYYKNNKEEINKKAKNYYQNNKEDIKQKVSEWGKDNKDKVLGYKTKYREKNKEELNKKRTEKIHCPKCLKSISKGNISIHLKVCPKNTI